MERVGQFPVTICNETPGALPTKDYACIDQVAERPLHGAEAKGRHGRQLKLRRKLAARREMTRLDCGQHEMPHLRMFGEIGADIAPEAGHEAEQLNVWCVGRMVHCHGRAPVALVASGGSGRKGRGPDLPVQKTLDYTIAI